MKKNQIFSNLRKKDYIAFLIAILLFIGGIVFLGLGIMNTYSKNTNNDYEINRDSDYHVILKDNPFYEEKTLEKEKYYVSSLIDYYKIDFKYNFIFNKKYKIKYKYNIEAIIYSNYDEGMENEIWSRKYILKEYTTKTLEDEDITISENIDIKYDYYNNLVKAFNEAYNINLNSILKVRFNITYNLGKKDIHDYIELDITLGDNISFANENYQKNTTKELDFWNLDISYLSFLLGIILIILALITIYLDRREVSINPYLKKKRNILREYQDLIIEVLNEPVISGKKILKVLSFDSLVSIAYGHDTHIIFYETILNKESNFYVVVDSYVYIFTLKV